MDLHCKNGKKASTLTIPSVTLTATYTSVYSKKDMDRFLRANCGRKFDLYDCQFFGDVLSKEHFKL